MKYLAILCICAQVSLQTYIDQKVPDHNLPVGLSCIVNPLQGICYQQFPMTAEEIQRATGELPSTPQK